MIFVNDKFIALQELSFNMLNRMRYGDCVFETILWQEGEIPLWKYHFSRLKEACIYLGLDLPEIDFLSVLRALISKNQLGKNVKIRLTIGRKYGVLYTPTESQSFCLIECEQLPAVLEKSIHQLGVYRENRKPTGRLSNLKSGNALLYVMAKKQALENQWNDILLLNHRDEIVEASSSNVFFVKSDLIYTPPLSSGCVAGTKRAYLLETESIIEQVVHLDEISDFDEIFLTNAIFGKMPVKNLVL